MQQHVELYVNQYTLDLGDEGLRALEYFLGCLRAQRLLA
jgi:predicted solute-binding protein